MEKISCGICSDIYDTDKHLPKSLGCGHTLCSMCLNKILTPESESFCPFCKERLERDDSYPTNFALLGVLDELKDFTSFKERFPEDFLKFEEEKTEVAEKQKSIDSYAQSCDDCIATVNEINDDISSKLHIDKAIEKSKEVTQILNVLKFSSKKWHKLIDYTDCKTFMSQLCSKARVGPVFAVHSFQNKDFFGSVTFHGTKCFLHSLSKEEIDRSSNATFVPFQDLKLCWMNKEASPFFKISAESGQEVIFEIQIGPNCSVDTFYIWCTGEMGLSYKGVTCDNKVEYLYNNKVSKIFTVMGFKTDNNNRVGNFHYIPYNWKAPMNVEVSDFYVTGYSHNGSFSVYKLRNYMSVSDVIGKIKNLPNFDNLISTYVNSKVLDCGVVFDYTFIQ